MQEVDDQEILRVKFHREYLESLFSYTGKR